jgi:hypothetical protein
VARKRELCNPREAATPYPSGDQNQVATSPTAATSVAAAIATWYSPGPFIAASKSSQLPKIAKATIASARSSFRKPCMTNLYLPYPLERKSAAGKGWVRRPYRRHPA